MKAIISADGTPDLFRSLMPTKAEKLTWEQQKERIQMVREIARGGMTNEQQRIGNVHTIDASQKHPHP